MTPLQGAGPSIAVLVVSCDKYSDLWEPFFKLFFRQWPNCPYKIYLGSNSLTYPNARVTSLRVGKDLSWGENVRKMLDMIGAEHVIFFLEDFLLKKPVDPDRIEALIRLAKEKSLGCLRLVAGLPLAFPPSSSIPGQDGLGIIGKEQRYRVSAQVAIWKVETLRTLLVDGMSAWEFEDIGTDLALGLKDEFWAVYESAICYDQFVEKGKWKPEGVEFCHKNNIFPDLAAREVCTHEEWLGYQARQKAASDLYLLQKRSEESFLAGNRLEGFRGVFRYARESGNYRKSILLALLGGLGATPLMLTRFLNNRYRLARLRVKAGRLKK